MGRQSGQYKPVQGGTRPQRRTGGVPGHLGHVGMYIPASTHTHLFMWPTCWAPVPGIRTPQTLTGIGFYVCWCWADWTGWGSPVCEPRPGWCGCLKVVQTAHDFAPLCTAFQTPTLYRFVPPCTAHRLMFIGVYVCGTNQYKPVQTQSNTVVQRYNTLWVYRCTAYQFQDMNQ